MSNELEIAWPKRAWVHPSFLIYIIASVMSDKKEDYIKEIGVTTDREFRIHELKVFCNNLTDAIAGDLADGLRTVNIVEEGENNIVTFPLKN